MELEELRQRLLLRSKTVEIPPLAHPVKMPEIALGHPEATQIKWETRLPDGVSKVGHYNQRPDNLAGSCGEIVNVIRAEVTPAPVNPVEKAAETERPMDLGSSSTKSSAVAAGSNQAEPISILASTSDQLSEPTEAFREHFAQLDKLLQPIDTATQSSEQALHRIEGLHQHLSSLANTFQSVKAFAEQVKTLSATFEPMKGLNNQLGQIIDGFYLNVKELGAALAPVKTFQLKVRRLATTLDSINQLEGQILELAEAFHPAVEKPATSEVVAQPEVLPQPEMPASVSQAA